MGVAQSVCPSAQNIDDDLRNALLIGEFWQVLKSALRVAVQLPHIAKRLNLGGQRPACGVFVNGVVGAVAVERRIEINQIHQVPFPFPQKSQAVAIKQSVAGR